MALTLQFDPDSRRGLLQAQLARLQRLKNDLATLRSATELQKRGFPLFDSEDQFRALGMIVAEDERGQVVARTLPKGRGFDTPAFDAYTKVAHRLAQAVRGRLAIALKEPENGSVMSFATNAKNSFLASLAEMSGTVGVAFRGSVPPSRTGLVPTRGTRGEGPIQSLEDFQLAAQATSDALKQAAGVPTDPNVLAILEKQGGLPGTVGAFSGDIAAWALASYLAPGPTGTGASSRFLRTLVPGGRGARLTQLATLGGASYGLVTGLGGFGLDEDNETDLRDRLSAAALGGAAPMFLGTLTFGRPVGMAARALHALERSQYASNLGALGRFDLRRRLAFQFAPRLTVGHMLNSAGLGAGVTTTRMIAQGAEPYEALKEGLKVGVEFIGYDVAFARLGGAQRLLDVQARAARNVTRYLLALGVPAASLTGAQLATTDQGDPNLMAGLGVAAAIGGAFGASALARGRGVGRRAGRIQTALASRGFLDEIARDPAALAQVRERIVAGLNTVLPQTEVEKILTGALGKLSPEDVQTTVAYFTNRAWRTALQEVEDDLLTARAPTPAATPAATKEARTFTQLTAKAGDYPRLPTEEAELLVVQQYALTKQLLELEAQGVPVHDPQVISIAMQYLGTRDLLRSLKRHARASVTIPDDLPIPVEGGEPITWGVAKARMYAAQEVALAEQRLARPRLPAAPAAPPLLGPAPTKLLGPGTPFPAVVTPPPRALKTPESRARALNAIDSLLQAEELDVRAARDQLKLNFDDLSITPTAKPVRGVQIKAAGLPTVRGTSVRSALRRLRDHLTNTSGLSIVAPVPGFLEYKDDENQPTIGWLPTASAAAALVTLGVVLPAGRHYRVGALGRMLRRVGMLSNRFGRESAFYLRNDGGMKFVLGTQQKVLLPEEDATRGILLMVHNHPGKDRAIRNFLPSGADLAASSISARASRSRSVSAILPAHTDSFTLLSVPGTIPKDGDLVERILNRTAGEIVPGSRNFVDAVHRSRAVGDPFAVATQVLNRLGVRAYFGVHEDALDTLIHTLYTQGIRESAQPRTMTEAIGAAVERPLPSHPLESTGDIFADMVAQRFNDETFRATLRNVFESEFGALPTPRAAPAGARQVKAVLPSSVTPQAFSGAPISLVEAQAWAKDRGFNISLDPATRNLIAYTQDGAEIARSRSLQDLYSRLSALAGQRGEVEKGLALTIAGGTAAALLGGVTESAVRRYMGFTDQERTAAGPIIGGLVGALATMGLAAWGSSRVRRAGIMATIADQLVQPKLTPLSPAQARAHARFKLPELPVEAWFRFPHGEQVEHLQARLEAIRNQKSPKGPRQGHLRSTLNKYTLFLLTPETLAALEHDVYSTAEVVGMSGAEAERLFLGYLNQVATAPHARAALSDQAFINLWRLDAPVVGPYANVQSLSEVRQRILGAKVLHGTAPPSTPPKFHEYVREGKISLLPDPEAIELGEILGVSNELSLKGHRTFHKGEGDWRLVPPFRWFIPAEGLRTTAHTIRRSGNVADADVMERFFNIGNRTAGLMEDETRRYHNRIASILQGLTGDEVQGVRWVLEGGAGRKSADWRTSYSKGNPRVVERADRVRPVLDEISTRLGLPTQEFLEDYFPLYYSQRTIRELRRTGLLADRSMGITLPTFSSIPNGKFFRSVLRRRFDEPIGPTLDTRDTLSLFVSGGVRKYHLDRMLVQLKADLPTLKELATRHPNWVRTYVNWVRDIYGVPSETSLAFQSMVESMGLDVEALAHTFNGSTRSVLTTLSDLVIESGDLSAWSSKIRGAEYLMKIGFNLISALVNLTQNINTATDSSMYDLFMGAGYAAQGKVAELVEARGAVQLAGFIDPMARGRKVLDYSRESGILGSRFQDVLDDMARLPQFGSHEGAMKAGLDTVRWLASWAFGTVEALNRAVASGAAYSQFQAATADSAIAGRTARELLAPTLAGALGGAGLGAHAARSEGGDPVQGAITGAIVGGLGAPALDIALSRGLPGSRLGRVRKELDVIAHTNPHLRIPEGADLRKALEMSKEDILKLYTQQFVEMTQFRFSKALRPEVARNPLGAAGFALQSFTFNQGEFLWSRFASMYQTLKKGETPDLRFLRYVTYWLAAGSVLSAIGGVVFDTDKSPHFWMSRIGFMALPFVTWNESAQTWQVNSIVDTFIGGPVVSDIQNTMQTIARLATDPVARASWDRELDRLSREMVVFLRQAQDNGELSAQGLEGLGQQGLAELARSAGSSFNNPLQFLVGATSAAARGNLSGAAREGVERGRRGRGGASPQGGQGGGGEGPFGSTPSGGPFGED